MNGYSMHRGRAALRLCCSACLKAAAVLAACIFTGLLLMTAVYAIPTEAAWENTKESLEALTSEGLRHEMIPGYKTSRLDTFTDAIMIGNAVIAPEETALRNALLTHRIDTMNSIDSLERYMVYGEDVVTKPYSIYWHGYLVLLKPLLCVMSISSICVLLMAAQLMAVLGVAVLLTKRGLSAYVLPLFAMTFSLCPAALMNCLTYSSVFLIGMLAAVLILLAHERLERAGYGFVFLLTGVLTSFFDFLTYPIFTLGIPLTVYVLMAGRNGGRIRLGRLALLCVAWGVGYGGMWAGKWLLVSLLTEVNGVKEALAEVLYRTSSTLDDHGEVSIFAGLESCLSLLLNPLTLFVFLACAVCCVLVLLRRGVCRGAAIRMGALALVALLPCAWLIFACNHSVSHTFYAYRSLAVLVFAGLSIPLAAAKDAG